MPYKKNYRRRSRRKFKTTVGGRTKKLVDGKVGPYVAMGVAAIPYILRTLRTLKSFQNTEGKFVDVATSSTISTTMTYLRLTEIAQGITDQTRIGNKILLKDLSVRLRFIQNSSATATAIRWVMFVDKECDGALPAAPLPLAASSTEAMNNMDFSKRFVTIKTGVIDLSINGNREATRKIYQKLNFHCDYDGAGSAVADAKENQIYIGFISSEATNTPTYNIYSRLKFYDT